VTSTPDPISKSDFRILAKNTILEIDSAKRKKIELSVQSHLRTFLKAKSPETIIAYRSDRWEIDIFPLVAEFPNINFFFPKIDTKSKNPRLKFLSGDFGWEKGNFGLWEPCERVDSEGLDPKFADIVFLPGLAFHEKGYRLGRGKGYYDQNLREVPRSSIYGVIWESCKHLDFPFEAHDIRAGVYISELGIHGFLD
jgi:5-formyltetrahydrofolate cyclo-ligase